MSEKDRDDSKAKADREKFESVKKIPTRPIITKGARGSRSLDPGVLQSPDEKNPKWIEDPEEVARARRAARRAKKSDNLQKSESSQSTGENQDER